MSKRRRKMTVEKWADMGMAVRNTLDNRLAKEEQDAAIVEALNTGVVTMDDVLSMENENDIRDNYIKNGMQIYLFDKDFMESFVNEKWSDLLPDVIGHSPYECFYMHLPYSKNSSGVVVLLIDTHKWPKIFTLANDDQKHLVSSAISGGKGVYSGHDCEYNNLFVNDGATIWMVAVWAIPKTIGMMFDEEDYGYYPNELIANGLAYLCSKNADINKVYEPSKNVTHKKNGKRENRYSNATWHEVGYHIGAELRAYKHMRTVDPSSSGQTVRPHVRRAHWHHYWTGPRNGERQLVLKWIPPILVAANNRSIDRATAHRVPTGGES